MKPSVALHSIQDKAKPPNPVCSSITFKLNLIFYSRSGKNWVLGGPQKGRFDKEEMEHVIKTHQCQFLKVHIELGHFSTKAESKN